MEQRGRPRAAGLRVQETKEGMEPKEEYDGFGPGGKEGTWVLVGMYRRKSNATSVSKEMVTPLSFHPFYPSSAIFFRHVLSAKQAPSVPFARPEATTTVESASTSTTTTAESASMDIDRCHMFIFTFTILPNYIFRFQLCHAVGPRSMPFTPILFVSLLRQRRFIHSSLTTANVGHLRNKMDCQMKRT